MRTAKQWASDLPESIREKFLEYLHNDLVEWDGYWEFKYERFLLKTRDKLDAASIADDEHK